MVVCDEPEIAARCRKVGNLRFEEKGRRIIHRDMSWNYRMTNVQAALGLAQLEFWDEHIARKKQIGSLYHRGLSGIPGLNLPMHQCSCADSICWVFGIVAQTEDSCRAITQCLNEKGIGTRPFFWCMHEQPVFRDMGLSHNEHFPVAEQLGRNGFYIPTGLGLTLEEAGKVIKTMGAAFE